MPAQPSARRAPWCAAMLVTIGILAATPAAHADIVFYQQDGFRGRSFIADQTIPNFADMGFNDRASSVKIRSGSWQLCTDAYFRGRCVTLKPGDYPSLSSMQLDNQVSSVRELDWQRPGPGGPPPGGPPPGGPRPAGQVELYEGNGFAGRAFPINGATSSFPSQFNDRASSMVVNEGYWEACENIGYKGACQVYGPGRYASLGGMSNRISSIHPVAASGHGPEAGGWGSGARALLYESQFLTGRSFIINDEVVPNLANTGFNDRASSLRIEGGYWMFCSEPNFTGECHTFGPGDYGTLPLGLTNKISSGRRIRDQYPYTQSPNWQPR